ncbi:MAG: DUF4190 domain-containing protein, partial [Ignavibacteria bacterium]|nr:DUF4190 domain-containing protein [Ignavibacteria bacterium]
PPPPPPPPPPPSSGGYNPGGSGSASTNAIISLVAGILSWIACPFVLGIVAWVMGKSELSKIERRESSVEGKTLATIGMWLGIANVILSVIGVLFYIIFVLIIGIASFSGMN